MRAGRASVLMFTKVLRVSAVAKLIANSVPHWDRDRFDYRVAYGLRGDDVLVHRIEEQGVPVDFVGSPRGFGPGVLIRFRRLVRAYRPDLIHAHLPLPGVVARLTSRVPVVYTENALVDSYVIPTRVANRLTYWRNRAVIAGAAEVAASVARYPGPTPVVIPNAVDAHVSAEDVSAARKDLGLGPGQPLVVHVGMIRPEKGHRTLLAAAKEVSALVPDVRIVSIGGERSPGGLAKLRAEAAHEGLDGTIRFMGFVENAMPFVGAADVFVNPSDTEGLPLAMLEAMMLGRPVVATAVGGVPEAVHDGQTGLLVPPRDPAALAKAIVGLLNDASRAAALGAEAQRLAERDYGMGRFVADTERLYDQILSSPSGMRSRFAA